MMYLVWPMLIYSNLNQCLIVIRILWYQHIKIFTFGASVPIITNAAHASNHPRLSPRASLYLVFEHFSGWPGFLTPPSKILFIDFTHASPNLQWATHPNIGFVSGEKELPSFLLDCHSHLTLTNKRPLSSSLTNERQGVLSPLIVQCVTNVSMQCPELSGETQMTIICRVITRPGHNGLIMSPDISLLTSDNGWWHHDATPASPRCQHLHCLQTTEIHQTVTLCQP